MNEDVGNCNKADSFVIGGKGPVASDELKKQVADLRVHVGTLLKTETVSFLFGAGVSVDCGGVLIGSAPKQVEDCLLEEGTPDNKVAPWLKLFYLASRCVSRSDVVPVEDQAILKRGTQQDEKLPANYEQVLSQLHRWRAALPEDGGQLTLESPIGGTMNAKDLDTCISRATNALAKCCILPTSGNEDKLGTFKDFLRKILTRPPNLKRIAIFTLNYDTLVEQAADGEGIVLIDGFAGTQRRVFRPECYEQDLYFPAETTEGRVHRFDRVLHLYKLHGSITWVAEEPTSENPYGIRATPVDSQESDRLLIYPTPAKYGETLGMPYAELFRRFAATVVRAQSVLFVVGYGFGDEHVNAIIRQALAVPSFRLVIVDPQPENQFVKQLRSQEDQRVWLLEGWGLGTFAAFVQHALPDLVDEEIRKKALATQRALREASETTEGYSDDQ